MADTQIVCRASYLSKDKAVSLTFGPSSTTCLPRKLLHFLNWFQGSYLRHVLDKNHTFDGKSNSTFPALPLADATRLLWILSKNCWQFSAFCAWRTWLIISLSEINKYLTFHRDRMTLSDLSPLTSRLSEGWVVTKLIFSCFPPPIPSLSVFWQESGRHFAVWTEEE